MNDNSLAKFGALLSDPTRAEILGCLMDGRAHTGSELARHIGVAPSTISEHLSKLLDAAMVTVEPQNRHRYFRIATPEMAELLETLGASPVVGPSTTNAPAELLHARTCYDHLAGELAVGIFDFLIANGYLEDCDHHVTISSSGLAFFESIGVDTDAIAESKRPKARPCLDWTQRRHHLAGAAGQQLLDALFANRWIKRGSQARSIRVTETGRTALEAKFGLEYA